MLLELLSSISIPMKCSQTLLERDQVSVNLSDFQEDFGSYCCLIAEMNLMLSLVLLSGILFLLHLSHGLLHLTQSCIHLLSVKSTTVLSINTGTTMKL